MRCAGEKERVNQEQQRRIIQLICERDRLQYRAQERRALRTEIEAALGMESLPGDVEDSSLKRGLAIIAGWKQEIASLKKEVEAFKKNNRYQRGYSHGEQSVRADLARVTAERDEQVNELVDARDQIYEQGRRACELFDLNRTTQKELAALRARNAELVDSLHLADGTANLALHHRDIAEKRNAELVAALRAIRDLDDESTAEDCADRAGSALAAIAADMGGVK
jgi:hypothetical protein